MSFLQIENIAYDILGGGALLIIAVTDMLWRRIPNLIIYPILFLTLAHSVMNGTLGSAFWGGLIGSIIFWIPVLIYGPHRAGIGDVKLALLIGLALGFPDVILAIASSFVFAASFVIMGLAMKKLQRHSLIPFGPFLVLGTFFTFALSYFGRFS